MPSLCAVNGCKIANQPDVIVHQFPGDQPRLDSWIAFCGRDSGWSPQKNQGICSVHFPNSSYDDGQRNRRKTKIPHQLVVNAIPVLHQAKNFEDVNLEAPTDIKQEPKQEPDSAAPETEHLDIVVELLDPMKEEDSDPIGELDEKRVKTPLVAFDEPRCLFCLKSFREAAGQGTMTRKMVLFVLGARKWVAFSESPDCCQDCQKMFEMFNEFKKSCLEALAHSTQLIADKTFEIKTDDCEPDVVTPPKRKVGRPRKISKSQLQESSESDNEGPSFQDDVEDNFIPINEDFKLDVSEPEQHDKKSDNECASSNTALNICPSPTGKDEKNSTKEPSSNDKKPRKRKYTKSTAKVDKQPPDDSNGVSSAPSNSEPEQSTKQQPKERKKRGVFPCTKCEQVFRTEHQLTLHINRHLGVRTVPCRREGCNKKFFDTTHRHAHEIGCGKEVKIMCTVCGAIFRSMSALRTHMASHGELKFFCKICDKGFFRKAKLDKHASVHSEQRNFECNICGKRFKSKEANRVHQRVHTEERPYVCHICNNAFRYNCGLKAHLEKGHDPSDLRRPEPTTAPTAGYESSGGFF
ncbi:zinc finger protein 91-like isoform X2 [Armigeres subalbatus]